MPAGKQSQVNEHGAAASVAHIKTENSRGEMLVFIHLEPAYKHRAWVLVDGDEVGKKVVDSLRGMFPGWPSENFSHFRKKTLRATTRLASKIRFRKSRIHPIRHGCGNSRSLCYSMP